MSTVVWLCQQVSLDAEGNPWMDPTVIRKTWTVHEVIDTLRARAAFSKGHAEHLKQESKRNGP